MENGHIETIFSFLRVPLDSGDKIFARFSALPGAVAGEGSSPLQRFVYVPGTREDRVVLVAHIDTVWDRAYKRAFSEERDVLFADGVFSSANPDCGIGADDRAGCAMLWEMRESGHSLLITDGEEHGKFGARYLKKSHKKLFRELNRHCFMIELDWMGTDSCLYNQVDNTNKFKRYIEGGLGCVDSKKKGGTDLQHLCRRICGVNIGIGYCDYHKNSEKLILADWENTFAKLSAFLALPQKRFRSLILPPYIRFAKRCVKKAISIVKAPFAKKTA